jgi:hypothetical protein
MMITQSNVHACLAEILGVKVQCGDVRTGAVINATCAGLVPYHESRALDGLAQATIFLKVERDYFLKVERDWRVGDRERLWLTVGLGARCRRDLWSRAP